MEKMIILLNRSQTAPGPASRNQHLRFGFVIIPLVESSRWMFAVEFDGLTSAAWLDQSSSDDLLTDGQDSSTASAVGSEPCSRPTDPVRRSRWSGAGCHRFCGAAAQL